MQHEGLERPIRHSSAHLGGIPVPFLKRLARDPDVLDRDVSPDAVPKGLIRALENGALPVTERRSESARVVQGHEAPVRAANRNQGQRERRAGVEMRVPEHAGHKRRVANVAHGSVAYNLNGLPQDVIAWMRVVVERSRRGASAVLLGGLACGETEVSPEYRKQCSFDRVNANSEFDAQRVRGWHPERIARGREEIADESSNDRVEIDVLKRRRSVSGFDCAT
jgi:hypothetical protein